MEDFKSALLEFMKFRNAQQLQLQEKKKKNYLFKLKRKIKRKVKRNNGNIHKNG